MIFGVLNRAKIWQRQLVHLPTLPVYWSDFTLGNPKKSFFNSIIHTYFRLFTLSQKKHTVTPCPPHLKNVTALPCKMQNFYIWLKVMLHSSNVVGSGNSRLWVGIGGSEKNRLWCVATGMSSKQHYSKCSKWPPSAWMHASVFFTIDQLHRPPRCAEIQPMSQQDASVTCPYRGLVLDTLASCPRCGNHMGWGQDCWLATRQTDELSHDAEAQLCHEHDVLAHCLAGRQTRLQ